MLIRIYVTRPGWPDWILFVCGLVPTQFRHASASQWIQRWLFLPVYHKQIKSSHQVTTATFALVCPAPLVEILTTPQRRSLRQTFWRNLGPT